MERENKKLVEELIEEHKETEKRYKSFKESLSNGKTVKAAAQIEEILLFLEAHVKNEEPLYKFMLKKYLEE